MLPKVGEIDCPGGFDDLNLQIYLGLGLVDKRPTLASIATKGIMISTLFASSKFVTNRNHFQVIAETGQTGQLHYDGTANGGHLFRPEDKDELDFSEPAMLFYAQESTT